MPQTFSTFATLARLRNAVSTPAEEVERKLGYVVASAQRSRALFGSHSDAIAAVWAVAGEAAEENWNGEGALPIDPAAAANAIMFIETLPTSAAMPEVSPEPDGAISLDWIESRSRMFSVSIGRNRCLPFAWLDGTARGYGVVSFDGEDMPDRVLGEIARIRVNGTATVGAG